MSNYKANCTHDNLLFLLYISEVNTLKLTKNTKDKLDELNELILENGLMKELIPQNLNDIEASAHIVECIVDYALKLSKVFLYSPDSIYLADNKGKTLAVNKAFEPTIGTPPENVIGSNLTELVEKGFFKPSVLAMVLKEKRPVSVLQSGTNGDWIIANGVPIFSRSGELEMAVANAIRVEDIESLRSYVDWKKKISSSSGKIRQEDKMIAASPVMKRTYSLIDQIKDTDVTIMITGPSGAGKGVLAKHIHDTSNRADKDMIEINCGAIPDNLIESELFGYEGGAFTGANTGGKNGLIEAADGGTLFLDEIADLPLISQVKLLKVLQDKKNTKLGSTVSKPVDVRIIAATNKDIKALVEQKLFREDLYYRLNVIRIDLPPIKERREDILEGIDYFLKKYMSKYNRWVDYTESFIEKVLSYDWPGNMRELENYIERSVITSRDGVLKGETQINEDEARLAVQPYNNDPHPLSTYMNKVEADIIRELYYEYRSSYKVADKLGISQSKAYRLIKKYCNLSHK